MPSERDKASDADFPTFRQWAISLRSMASRMLKWRPRFSLRTLLILTAMLGAYLGCWLPTKTRGVRDVERTHNESPQANGAIQTVACLPLIIGLDDSVNMYGISGSNELLELAHRNYYFWFFGYVAKLPYEREVEWDDPFRADRVPAF